MSVHKVKGEYLIYKAKKSSEMKFRKELSRELIENFENKIYTSEEVTEVLKYSIEYFTTKFESICRAETSIRFYQHIFKFHDQATQASYDDPHKDLSPEISIGYLATYRRILKLIMEMGCEIKMHNREKTNAAFKLRFQDKLSDLIYLGEMIFTCGSLYAEQSMIEDVADIVYDINNLFSFTRRHHYDHIFKHFDTYARENLGDSVLDDSGLSGFEDLKAAINRCLGIEYGNVGHLIASIHKMNEPKGGDMVGVEWKTLPYNMETMYGVDLEMAKTFFSGLTLNKSNKMSVLDCAVKQYALNRYLYRPIVIWNVEGEDYAFFSKYSWMETFFQLSSNAIPWGKASQEWKSNKCLNKYINKKQDDHDRWLDDSVEEKLIANHLMYDRNAKKLKHKSGVTSFDIKDLGEIDFIIVSEALKKVLIVDCKHLVGRYDIPSQRNDYNAFTKGKKPYNETIARKVEWFKSNKDILCEHFELKYKVDLDLTDYQIEGVFFINTPTLYMYNSEFRIYTIHQVENVVFGNHQDPIFEIIIDEGDHTRFLSVNYPYFQKPKYLRFDFFDDEEDY
ncbi:hypothetical protein [Croceibacter atlanticus]|uniref:hypothetical protein n=2 Tax=Croceibacter atlanticus TaxID=313588 RepID=UPI00248F6B78|nr:hypothetical protein [Croceibacter atlanticus]